MRNIIHVVFFISAMFFVTGCSEQSKQESVANDLKYTCPMHPQIIQDHPGHCPVCKMDLVAQKQQKGESASIELTSDQLNLANIKTMKVTGGAFSSSKVLNGRLVVNPQASEIISSKYAGRIEKLFVKETGTAVAKGQPLYQIFSEQLQALQQDYLLQLKQTAAFPQEKIYQQLKSSARNKLELFGFSGAQLGALERSGKVSPTITVSSPVSGVVRELNLSEGQYVSEGSSVFRIENFDSLWLEVDVYPSEVAAIKPGTRLTATINGTGIQLPVRVDFVAPGLNSATQILTARGTMPNPGGTLQPGMQATVLLQHSEVKEGISLPIDAIIRSRKGTHVWIKSEKNTFEPRLVSTGAEDADRVIITSGLSSQDEVVISGSYLLYSEFVLKKGEEPLAVHNH